VIAVKKMPSEVVSTDSVISEVYENSPVPQIPVIGEAFEIFPSTCGRDGNVRVDFHRAENNHSAVVFERGFNTNVAPFNMFMWIGGKSFNMAFSLDNFALVNNLTEAEIQSIKHNGYVIVW